MISPEQISMRLFSENHPLEWRIDTSVLPVAMMLVSDIEPGEISSTKLIQVKKGKRKSDNRWFLHFALTNERYDEVFAAFCSDMIDNSWDVLPNKYFNYISNRYELWNELFSKEWMIELHQIQGLIGELIALRDVLIPRYGELPALKSWMNSRLGKQDFICKDCWYEVKTILEDKKSIKISSLEQLDRTDKGIILIVTLRKSSTESQNGIILRSLSEEMIKSFKEEKSKKILEQVLSLRGYTDECDKHAFEIKVITEYNFSPDFPHIKKNDIMDGIIGVTYQISIESIEKFKVVG